MSFRALMLEKQDGGPLAHIVDLDDAALSTPEALASDVTAGDVLIRVDWSTINYKDGLALTGKAPVVRKFPMVPGIDFAGTVESSSHADFKSGDRVLLNFPAANRDPKQFEDPDTFIVDRQENRHAAFGLGIHRCIGSNLARLELKVAIEEFIRRFPRFELAEEARWSVGQIRGPRELPVRILEVAN